MSITWMSCKVMIVLNQQFSHTMKKSLHDKNIQSTTYTVRHELKKKKKDLPGCPTTIIKRLETRPPQRRLAWTNTTNLGWASDCQLSVTLCSFHQAASPGTGSFIRQGKAPRLRHRAAGSVVVIHFLILIATWRIPLLDSSCSQADFAELSDTSC